MKFERLEINNFLRIRHLDANLQTAKVHIFGGHNESGKTSLAEAIRFGLVGDTPRVPLKKDYRLLLSTGSKKGDITIETDNGTIRRGVATAKPTGDSFEDAAALRLLLGAREFSEMPERDRRGFMFELCGVEYNREIVAERLGKRKVPEHMIKRVLPMLRAGFEAALKEAKRELSEARGRWEGIAGVKYGQNKAVGWKVDWHDSKPKEPDQETMELIAEGIGTLSEELEQANQQLGIARANANLIAETKVKIEEFQHAALEMKREMSDLATAKILLDDELMSLEEAEQLLELATTAGAIMACPSCDTLVTLENGELIPANPDALNAIQDEAAMAKLKQAVEHHAGKSRQFKESIAKNEEHIRRGRSAHDQIEQMEQMVKEHDEDTIKQAQDAVEKIRIDLNQHSHNLEIMKQDESVLKAAEGKEEQAEEARKDVIEWEQITDAFAPDGIPGELLAEALKPINKLLKASSDFLGWGAVTLGADMNIDRDGIPYGLLSESARWKCNAMICEAIAQLSGLKFLILDRMDVLDVNGRVTFIKWIESIAGDYDTIIILGTFKKEPAGLPDIFSTHWLDSGKLFEEGEEAA